MTFKDNAFYKIASFGPEAIQASETLLKSYPLTKICLEILGKKLLQTLEFGFFNPGFKIITQGEQGKDLFLLCNHIADVIVFNKVIVQMDGPSLFGDKAIIDRNSTRNATIGIAEGGPSLVIKIPMGQFLRNFKISEIEDASFNQEKQIYYNLFLEIQNRLFKYSEIQKKLWDEVNKQLKLLNMQLITGSLGKQEDKKWEPKTWQVIHQYLQSVHKFSWPTNVQYSTKTLIDILKTILDKKLPRTKFKGTDQAYTYQKQMVWKRWLETMAELLLKVLPSDQLPINIGEIELFNPRIYQMRMHTLLVSIQRKFMFKKVPPREGSYDPEKLKARIFFSNKKAENEFNLEAYLKTLNEMFQLKNPNRVLSQVAQQTAQLSATCENEFNASVSRMQAFLEKVRKLAIVSRKEETEQEKIRHSLNEIIAVFNQGFKAYNNRVVGHTHTYAGVIRFAESKVPLLSDIVKTCGSDKLKKNLVKSFNSLLDLLELKPAGFPEGLLKDQYFICQGSSEDIIPESQLTTHYWIPISEGITLKKGKKSFGHIKPGTLVGSSSWEQNQDEESKEEIEEWTLCMPTKKADQPPDFMFLLFVIPKRRIPWVYNSEPIPEEFEKMYQPLLQWIIQKNMTSISLVSELRDTLIKKYSQVIEVVVTEKKVREFENNKNKIQQAQYSRILKLIYENLGISLEKRQSISSEKLSKQLYNEIVKQTKQDFPKLSVEEQGNKAYTLWRFIQSEIVSKVYADEFAEKVKIETPKSIFTEIKEEIELLLEEKKFTIPENSIAMTDEGGDIRLKTLLNPEQGLLTNEYLEIALCVSQVVEQHFQKLVDKTITYQSRLKQISAIQTEFDVNEIQSKFILDAIAKLQHILKKKFSDIKKKGEENPDQ